MEVMNYVNIRKKYYSASLSNRAELQGLFCLVALLISFGINNLFSFNNKSAENFHIGSHQSKQQNSSENAVNYDPNFSFIASKIMKINPQANAEELARIIIQEARAHTMDPLIVASIILAESTFKTTAVSHKGALGLMQLMPATAEYVSEMISLEERDYTDPRNNIRLGITYFKYLKDMFNGNKSHALMAYNWGPGKFKSALNKGKEALPAVKDYANKIIKTYNSWQNEISVNSELQLRAQLNLSSQLL